MNKPQTKPQTKQKVPTLDIVLVNWNTGQQLYDCLRSIAKTARTGFDLEHVFVVDNASTDGSMDSLADSLAADNLPLNAIINPENRGFAVACNQGARAGHADYVLFLNPDTRLFADSLSTPINFMQQDKNKQIGICGIHLIDDEGEPTIAAARFPTLRVLLGKMSGLSRLAPALFPPHMMDASELSTSQRVDQIIGAYFLMRRNVYELCNGFDERFFVYFEEVDLALRAKNAGFDSYYFADATAYHKGGGATDAVRAHRLFYSMRSRMQYAQKHFSSLETALLFLLTFLVELPARLLRATSRGSLQQTMETCSGFAMLIRSYLAKTDQQKIGQKVRS